MVGFAVGSFLASYVDRIWLGFESGFVVRLRVGQHRLVLWFTGEHGRLVLPAAVGFFF